MHARAVVTLRIVFPVNLPVALDRLDLLVHRVQLFEWPVLNIRCFITQKIDQVLIGRIAQVDEDEAPPGVGVDLVQGIIGSVEIVCKATSAPVSSSHRKTVTVAPD